MKSQGRRKIGQPIPAGSASHGITLFKFPVKGIHGFCCIGKFLPFDRHPKGFGHPFKNVAHRTPKGCQGQFVHLDEGQISKKYPLTKAKGHCLRNGLPGIFKFMIDQVCRNAAFTMGRLGMYKIKFH